MGLGQPCSTLNSGHVYMTLALNRKSGTWRESSLHPSVAFLFFPGRWSLWLSLLSPGPAAISSRRQSGWGCCYVPQVFSKVLIRESPPPPAHLQAPLPETLAEETLNVNGVLLRSNECRASSACQGSLQQTCSRRW